MGLKLAITGKGGVGKTTFCALLCGRLAERQRRVVAIDADPDSNLAACLGVPQPESIRPLVELKDLVEERTGVRPGTTGGMFKLNPFVEDIPERYAVEVDGIRVLVAGAVKKGGSGCYCPENALLRALISHLLLEEGTDLVVDMEAGVEHLGRGTVRAVDRLLVIIEPGRRSIDTALRIKRMADDIGLGQISVVVNKLRKSGDEHSIRSSLRELPFAGFLPYDEQVGEAERNGLSVLTVKGALRTAVDGVIDNIEHNTVALAP